GVLLRDRVVHPGHADRQADGASAAARGRDRGTAGGTGDGHPGATGLRTWTGLGTPFWGMVGAAHAAQRSKRPRPLAGVLLLPRGESRRLLRCAACAARMFPIRHGNLADLFPMNAVEAAVAVECVQVAAAVEEEAGGAATR